MSEAAVLLVSIPTSDTLTMSDDNAVLATGLNKEDSVVVSEVLAKSFTAEKSDAVSLTEAPVLTPGLSKTDTISMSESFSRVVSYLRSFTDGFTLDDLASVDDPLQTDVGLDKTNITTLSEEHIYSLSKGLTDSFAITENAELLLSKPETDSLTLSEAASLLNALTKTETLTMSETLVYLINNVFTDQLSLAESHAKTLNKQTLDTASLSDQEVLLSSKSLTDQTSVTESINVALIVNVRGLVLNTRALNTGVLN